METTLSLKTLNGFLPLTYSVKQMIAFLYGQNFFYESRDQICFIYFLY